MNPMTTRRCIHGNPYDACDECFPEPKNDIPTRIKLTDSEYSAIKKRAIDEKKSAAELMGEILRDALKQKQADKEKS